MQISLLNHNFDGISRFQETGRNQIAIIQISRAGFATKNKKVLIFYKINLWDALQIFKNQPIEIRVCLILFKIIFLSNQYSISYMVRSQTILLLVSSMNAIKVAFK